MVHCTVIQIIAQKWVDVSTGIHKKEIKNRFFNIHVHNAVVVFKVGSSTEKDTSQNVIDSYSSTLMSSQPVSSATSVGAVKGYVRRTPFSVPTQRELWAGTMVEICMGI